MSGTGYTQVEVKFDQFDATLNKFLSANPSPTVVVHITSDNDASTSKQWCPDCRKTAPKLYPRLETLAKNQSLVVIEAFLPKPGYKENPFRNHPQLSLTAIPTLYLWGKNGVAKKLVEDECYDDDKLNSFFEETSKRAKTEKMDVENKEKSVVASGSDVHVWTSHIKEVLFSETVIQKRVAELAQEISRDYHGKEILVVGLLNGAFMFVSDILRRITCAYQLDFMVVSSYGSGTTSSRNIKVKKDLSIDPAGKHVLVLEDLIDTGHTLSWIRQHIQSKNPASFKMGVLLDKKARREVEVPMDFVGMECPDEFVVGYGMDFNEHYRCLPYIGVLKSSLYEKH